MTFLSLLSRDVNEDTLTTPFYLDMLKENGVDIDALTVDDFLYRDQDLMDACDALMQFEKVVDYLQYATDLLEEYPTNSLLLYTIARTGVNGEISLKTALAMRQLASVLLTRTYDTPLRDEVHIKVGVIGVDVLFQYLLLLDFDDHLLPMMVELIRLTPQAREVIFMTALRASAICSLDDEDNIFIYLRDMCKELKGSDPEFMWHVLLAETVFNHLSDEPDDELLASQIQQLASAPLTPLQQMELDFYIDMDPMLSEFFDTFNAPPTEPLPSNPAKDLHRLIARQNFSSPEEVSDFVAQFMNTPIPVIPDEELTDDERAEDAVEAILHARPDTIHDQLLALTVTYPTSLWPWLGLSRISETAADSLIYAEKGLALANHTTEDLHAKSYVELLDCKAYALMHESRYAEAIETFEQLISIEEHRQITNGEALLALLLRRGQRQHLDRADQIITTLQAEGSEYLPALPWLVLLHRMITKRDTSVINVAVADAMNTLPYVGLIITGLHADQTSYHIPRIDTADEDATIHAITLAQICWPVYPEAVKKLKKMLTHPDGPL